MSVAKPRSLARGVAYAILVFGGLFVLWGVAFFAMTRDPMLLLLALFGGGVLVAIGYVALQGAQRMGSGPTCASCRQGNPAGARQCSACGQPL